MNILDYCAEKSVYLYGAGEQAELLYQRLNAENIEVCSFIISDGQTKKAEKINDIHVVTLSEYMDSCGASGDGIVLAVGMPFQTEVISNLKKAGISTYYIPDRNDFELLQRLYRPLEMTKVLYTTEPVSRLFGYDRGTPLDRYYIEKFLRQQSGKIQNVTKVYEVAEDAYSRKYFPHAEHDILNFKDGTDLTNPETLQEDTYDVFICTQVLPFIYDIRAAIAGCYRLLKNNGVLLATVSGCISPISLCDYSDYGEYWRFTDMAIRSLMEETFGKGKVKVVSFGNAMAATAFVQGVAYEELEEPELMDISDPLYSICIGIVAEKDYKSDVSEQTI